MKTACQTLRLLGLLAISLCMGCASAYHDYSECRVNCRYCSPPPLPYACYPQCVCHSRSASEYLSTPAPAGPHEAIAVDLPQ